MVNVSITKEFTWDMAHMLAGHEGLCKNIHGHTYKMQVEVTRKTGDLITTPGNSQEGMVIDFNHLKNIVKDKIIDPLNHAFMYWCQSPDSLEHEIAELLRKHGRKIAVVTYKPTAEEMARNFLKILSREFDKHDIIIQSVKVWETPTSFATARQEGKYDSEQI